MNTWGKKRSLIRRYNLTAEIYDARYGEEQDAKYKVALEGLNLNYGSPVLDVGCGSGMFFSHVANEVEVVVGVDVSRKLLLRSNERAKAFHNVFLVLADADFLPFREGYFGLFFAFTVLQNLPKPVEMLRRLKLVGRRDAYFVVTGLKAAMSMEVLGEMLEAAGLQAVAIRNDDALRCYVVTSIMHKE